MRGLFLLVISNLFIHSLHCQHMHTEEELQEFKKIVSQTRQLGREKIVYIALTDITDDPESVLKNDKVTISVWYNDLTVKVDIQEHSPIRYFPMNTKYHLEKTIYVSMDHVSGSSGSIVYNQKKEQSVDHFSKVFLYQHTEAKKKMVSKVFQLNNRNDPQYYLDSETQRHITIREHKDHYRIQIGDQYAITYNIDKESGKIYDYDDPYKNFYPTPTAAPFKPKPLGGSWIEIKE